MGFRIRFLHFADLHLGVETYGRTDPETGLSSRMADILASLDYLVDYAINTDVDLVVFCGDAYKDRSPGPTLQREFARRIKRLSQENIPIFILVGNHDLPNAVSKATATEIFETLEVDNVYVASKPGVVRIKTKNGDIQVLALPWLRRANLLNKDELKNLDIESLHAKMEEIITRVITEQVEKLDSSIPAVMAGHLWVKGAKPGTEIGSVIGREPEILTGNVATRPLDYVALGHIHRRQIMSENVPVVYSGSLVKLDFSDTDDEKGFFEVEIIGQDGDRKTVFNFQPAPGRRFVTIQVRLENEDADPTAKILEAVSRRSKEVENSIVRLELNFPREMEGLIRDSEIKNALKKAHYLAIARLPRQPFEKNTSSAYYIVESIKPVDALKTWLETHSSSEEFKTVALEYGTRLIKEITEN